MTNRGRWLSRVPRRGGARPAESGTLGDRARAELEAELAGENEELEERDADGELELPPVAFLPVRCPGCGSDRQKTTGAPLPRGPGRLRYHVCRDCGLRFRSVEIHPRGA